MKARMRMGLVAVLMYVVAGCSTSGTDGPGAHPADPSSGSEASLASASATHLDGSEQRLKGLIYNAINVVGRALDLVNVVTGLPADDMARSVHMNAYVGGERELVSGHGDEEIVHRCAAVNVLTPAVACCHESRRVAQGSRNTEAVFRRQSRLSTHER